MLTLSGLELVQNGGGGRQLTRGIKV